MKPADMADKSGQAAHQDWRALSAPDKLDRMLEMMKAREKNLAEHAATVRAFYDTLSVEQKQTFDKHFMQFMRHHRPAHSRGQGDEYAAQGGM